MIYQDWVSAFINEVIEGADFYGEGFYIIKDTVGTENIRTRASLWYYNSITLTQIIAPFYIASEIQEPEDALPEAESNANLSQLDFVVSQNVNDLIYINEDSEVRIVQIPAGQYNRSTLQTAVNTALNGSENLSLTYYLGYNTQTRLFNIDIDPAERFGGATFALPNGSSPYHNLLTMLLGWDAVNVSGESYYSATTAREEI